MVIMLIDVFLDIFKNIWPMVFIFTIIIVSIRIVYLISNKKKIIFYKELLMLFFIIYILLLYYIVTFQDNNYGTNNLVPFKEIFRYSITSKLFIKNVIGNVLLFVPLGIFCAYYINNKKVYIIIFLSILISSSIEFAQYKIGRTLDIDDVILNTIGAVLGFFLYKLWHNITLKIPNLLKSQILLDFLSLMFIFAIIYLSFKFNFWRFLS